MTATLVAKNVAGGFAHRTLFEGVDLTVRPGGHVYLLDGDVTAMSITPSLPDTEDLTARYQRWHADRGNDLRVGRQLATLVRAAGLEVRDFRGWFEMGALPPGVRGPAWAARDALVAAGLAGSEDLARWEAAHAAMDTWEPRPEYAFATFAVVARRPA